MVLAINNGRAVCLCCVSRKFVPSTDNQCTARVLMLFGEENRVFDACSDFDHLCKKHLQKNKNVHAYFVGHLHLLLKLELS